MFDVVMLVFVLFVFLAVVFLCPDIRDGDVGGDWLFFGVLLTVT